MYLILNICCHRKYGLQGKSFCSIGLEPIIIKQQRRNRIDKSRRMRPEFVRRYKKPLASLAYSNPAIAEGVSNEVMVTLNREVREATEYLLSTVRPHPPPSWLHYFPILCN